ncbi:MAG: M48 family metalloprotease [Candidatus Heimdallarchaeota archaeon]|nr:M48 family metalloprotease [Candidatus Heimdallarchaeota archaeon]
MSEEIISLPERVNNLTYLKYKDYIAEINDTHKQYHDKKLRLELAGILTDIVLLIFLVLVDFGGSVSAVFNLDTSYSIIGTAIQIILLIFILFSKSFLIGYLAEKIEQDYDFSTLTMKKWIKRQFKALFLIILIAGGAIIGIYKFIDMFPESWWIYTFLAYFIFFAIIQFLFPILIVPMFFKLNPFPKGELREKMENLANSMGIKFKDIYLWSLSDATKKVNAAVMGFGSSIRIVLGDTLVKEFRDDEIEIVMCHEIAHQKHRDIYRQFIFNGIISMISFIIIFQASEYFVEVFAYGTFSNPATIPVFVMLFLLIQQCISVLSMSFSRSREKAADLAALQHINNIEIYESAFTRLAKTSMSYPDPSTWEVLFLYSHPPIRDRIAYAKKVVKQE